MKLPERQQMTDAQARIQAATQALDALRKGFRTDDQDVVDFWYGELLDATDAYKEERARAVRPGAPVRIK